MAESLSTARVDIVVTTEQMDAAIAAGRAKFQAFSQEGQKAFEGMTAAQRRSAESLVKQAALIGKSREEAIIYNAAWKGFPTPVLESIKQQLLQTAEAQKKVNAGQAEFERRLASNFVGGSKAFADTQKSARELQSALRSLPAQITDIFVSLQAGQNPMNVLFQQGGQLRDTFGGIRPAIAALGQSLLGLVNPVTGVIAVLGTLGVAFYQATSQANAFTRSLILSGNEAGLATDDLQGMADGDKLHPLQQQFIDHAALQCGVCTPGFLMAAKALLAKNPDPTEEEIRFGLAGNLCRCTGYDKIVRAVQAAAKDMRGA